jgi:hypothetical protein
MLPVVLMEGCIAARLNLKDAHDEVGSTLLWPGYHVHAHAGRCFNSFDFFVMMNFHGNLRL